MYHDSFCIWPLEDVILCVFQGIALVGAVNFFKGSPEEISGCVGFINNQSKCKAIFVIKKIFLIGSYATHLITKIV